MSPETDEAIRIAAKAAADLLRDLRGTAIDQTGWGLREVLRATAAAATSWGALATDLRGSKDTGTIGEHTRNTLRSITNAAQAIEGLVTDLKGFHSAIGGRTTRDELRAALRRIGGTK